MIRAQADDLPPLGQPSDFVSDPVYWSIAYPPTFVNSLGQLHVRLSESWNVYSKHSGLMEEKLLLQPQGCLRNVVLSTVSRQSCLPNPVSKLFPLCKIARFGIGLPGINRAVP
jgi:hypothetical protein